MPISEKYVESDSDDEVLGPIVPFSRKPPSEDEAYDSDRDPDWAPFAVVGGTGVPNTSVEWKIVQDFVRSFY